MKRTLYLFVLICTNFPLQTTALDVMPGDILSGRYRFSPDQGTYEEITIYYPTAVLPDGDDLIIKAGTISKGQIWRYSPGTGQQALIYEAGDVSPIFGLTILAGVFEDEVYFQTGGNSAGSLMTTALNLVDGSTRAFKIGGVDVGRNDIVVAANGNLVTTAGIQGIIIADRMTGETIASPGSIDDLYVKALTKTSDGRVIASASTNNLNDGKLVLLEVNADTGTLTRIADLPDLDLASSYVRLAVGPEGDYFVSVSRASNEFAVYRISGEGFATTPIVLPDDVEVDNLSDVAVDSEGNLLVGVLDKRSRLAPEAMRILLRIDPDTGDSEIAVGHAGGQVIQGFMAPGYNQDVYFVNKPAGVGATVEHVYRMDLITGGVTAVTTGDGDGAVLVGARQIAVHENDIYVINEVSSQNFNLVHVDATTGAQTDLGFLESFLYPQYMIFEERTGHLLLTAWGGNPQSGFGSVFEIDPVSPTLQVVSTTPFTGNPTTLAVGENGDVFVVVRGVPYGIYQVTRPTGEVSLLSEDPAFTAPLGIVVLDNGNPAIVDSSTRSLYEIDINTGAATARVTGSGFGSGFSSLIKLPGAASGTTLSGITQSTGYDGGWYESGWYGWFNELGQWIVHLEHGWQYFGGGSATSIFMYDTILGAWLWVSQDIYPLLYAFEPYNDWLIYAVGGEPTLRWFFSYNDNAWFNSENAPPP